MRLLVHREHMILRSLLARSVLLQTCLGRIDHSVDLTQVCPRHHPLHISVMLVDFVKQLVFKAIVGFFATNLFQLD